MRAEASFARSELAATVNGNWLDLAEPQAIGETWIKARQRRDYDPHTFGPYVEQLREGTERRFGVDLEDVATAEEAVRELEASALAEREPDDRIPDEQGAAAHEEQRSLVDEVAAAGVSYTARDDLNADRRDADELDDRAREEERADRDLVDHRTWWSEDLPCDSARVRDMLEQRALDAGVDVAPGQ